MRLAYRFGILIHLIDLPEQFLLSDLRKFAEQYGDIVQWDQSNRAYIMTHHVSGIDWKHYKHPLPENVYDVYMQYWADLRFSSMLKKKQKEAQMLLHVAFIYET